MARKQSNSNGFITASDDVEGWSVKIPATAVDSVISTLNYAKTLPPQVDAEKRGKRGPKKGAKPAVKVEAPVEAPKRRGRKPKDAEAPKAESTKPKMIDVLTNLAAKGPVTYEQVSGELVAQGHRPGAIANFLKSKDFNKQGHYVPAS